VTTERVERATKIIERATRFDERDTQIVGFDTQFVESDKKIVECAETFSECAEQVNECMEQKCERLGVEGAEGTAAVMAPMRQRLRSSAAARAHRAEVQRCPVPRRESHGG